MNNSLEQENDFLKQCIKIYMECCEERQERIDKAIEYMNQHKELIAIMGTYYFKLLNILQGEE